MSRIVTADDFYLTASDSGQKDVAKANKSAQPQLALGTLEWRAVDNDTFHLQADIPLAGRIMTSKQTLGVRTA